MKWTFALCAAVLFKGRFFGPLNRWHQNTERWTAVAIHWDMCNCRSSNFHFVSISWHVFHESQCFIFSSAQSLYCTETTNCRGMSHKAFCNYHFHQSRSCQVLTQFQSSLFLDTACKMLFGKMVKLKEVMQVCFFSFFMIAPLFFCMKPSSPGSLLQAQVK